QHVLGRVRFATSRGNLHGLASVPLATTGFHTCGPFAETNKDKIYDTVFGPELATELDQAQKFGKHKGSYNDKLLRGATNALSNGSGATYVAQRLWAASAREVEVALGSDDGFQLFLDGKAVAEQRVDRGVALAQDRVKLQ